MVSNIETSLMVVKGNEIESQPGRFSESGFSRAFLVLGNYGRTLYKN